MSIRTDPYYELYYNSIIDANMHTEILICATETTTIRALSIIASLR